MCTVWMYRKSKTITFEQLSVLEVKNRHICSICARERSTIVIFVPSRMLEAKNHYICTVGAPLTFNNTTSIQIWVLVDLILEFPSFNTIIFVLLRLRLLLLLLLSELHYYYTKTFWKSMLPALLATAAPWSKPTQATRSHFRPPTIMTELHQRPRSKHASSLLATVVPLIPIRRGDPVTLQTDPRLRIMPTLH